MGAAYALLREQGWLDSRRGSGSRLRLPDSARSSGGSGGAATRPTNGRTPFGPGGIFGWQESSGWQDGNHGAAAMGIIDLTTACLPAPALGEGSQRIRAGPGAPATGFCVAHHIDAHRADPIQRRTKARSWS